MSADAHLWMDKCYDGNLTFVEFYTLCRRLSLNPSVEFTSTFDFQCPSLQAAASPKELSGSPSKRQGTGLKL